MPRAVKHAERRAEYDAAVAAHHAIYQEWLALWRKMVHPEKYGEPTEEEAEKYLALAGRKRLALAEVRRCGDILTYKGSK